MESTKATVENTLPPEGMYNALPITIQEKASVIEAAEAGPSSRAYVGAFLKNRLPQKEGENALDELKKPFSLLKAKGKKNTKNQGKHRVRRKQLTANEKRKLGLYKLPRQGLKYEGFVPLHNLWKEYMCDYLELDQLKKLGWTPVPHDKHQDQLYLKLLKADYHGCMLQVTRSKCPSYIGLVGIVIMESKNTLQIISKDSTVRTVPKQNCVFTFQLKSYMFTIYGNQFKIRPSERAVKKMKSRVTVDL